MEKNEAYKALAAATAGKAEESARNTVMRGLAAINYRSMPRILEGRHDGTNFRIYHWSNTPLGDLLLVSGASVASLLLHGSDLAGPDGGDIYIKGSIAGGKVGEKVEAYLKSAAVNRAAKSAKEAGVPPTRATSPKPERAPKPRAEKKPPVEVVERKRTGGRKTGEAHKPDAEAYRRQREAEEAEAARKRLPAGFREARQAGRERFERKRTAGAYTQGVSGEGAGVERDWTRMMSPAERERHMAGFQAARKAGRERFEQKRAPAAPAFDAAKAQDQMEQMIAMLKARKAAKKAAQGGA